jgi:hypothetical protein
VLPHLLCVCIRTDLDKDYNCQLRIINNLVIRTLPKVTIALLIGLGILSSIAMGGAYGQVPSQTENASPTSSADSYATPQVQKECQDLTGLAEEYLNKLDPTRKSKPEADANEYPPAELRIPSLTLQGIKKYDKPDWYQLTEGSKVDSRPASEKSFQSQAVPSYTLYQHQTINVAYGNGAKPLLTKIYLEGKDPASLQTVASQFKEKDIKAFEVPSVDPGHCYLLKIDTEFPNPDTGKRIKTQSVDLVKIEEP